MEYTEHEKFMRLALEDAKAAGAAGDVPVGCVIVCNDEVIARAGNTRQRSQDATAHCELLAIRAACAVQGTYRLEDCVLYVTLEPCPMCAGAAVNARLKGIVYGASDQKAGYCGSLHNTPQDARLNHRMPVTGGVLQEECAALLSAFFQKRRKEKANAKAK